MLHQNSDTSQEGNRSVGRDVRGGTESTWTDSLEKEICWGRTRKYVKGEYRNRRLCKKEEENTRKNAEYLYVNYVSQ
jgi:hypothetical protein